MRGSSGSSGSSQIRARGFRRALVLSPVRTGGAGGQWLRWAGDSHRLQVLVSPRGVLWLPHVGRAMLCWDDKPPRAVSHSQKVFQPQLEDILVP